MTEPGAGSDLRAMSASARRDGAGYVLDGSKTFVTSGIQADRVIVAGAGGRGLQPARGRGGHGGLRARPQARQGRPARAGHRRAVLQRRPRARREPARRGGQGPALPDGAAAARAASIAVAAVAAAEHALRSRSPTCSERHAFGQPIGSFQHNRFTLASLHRGSLAARAYIDQCIVALNDGELSGADAASAKALHDRPAVRGARRLRPAPRRLRLHERVRDLAAVARCPRAAHLRRAPTRSCTRSSAARSGSVRLDDQTIGW